jgi:signal transduction histidine kinase
MLNDISARQIEERKKSEFISTVSHELRSPLTSIKGSMGLLLSKAAGDIPDKALSLLEIAHRNADRLVLIINDILDLEKIAAGRMEFEIKDVDLSELVEETRRANAMLHQRFDLEIKVNGTDKPRVVRTDPNRIIQVLTNFLSNASKFSAANSKIEIMVEDLEDDIRISVRDEGAGIPKKDQHKIFERFADLGNSDRVGKGGTGLGLSICKAIIEGLGGSIGFNSKEGVGTTFFFALPKHETVGLRSSEEADDLMREAS